jgi:gamma-glutamyltranspeptidase / glutathione hydrolase
MEKILVTPTTSMAPRLQPSLHQPRKSAKWKSEQWKPEQLTMSGATSGRKIRRRCVSLSRRQGMVLRLLMIGVLAGLLALLSWPQTAQAQRGTIAPEVATGRFEKRLAVANRQMVVAAHPLAVEAGLAMLRADGSAADAAIAMQLVLNLVEPQSSGLGGGAFALHWDRTGRQLASYDGREMAPAAAWPDRFIVNGSPMPFGQAVASGLSVGVPGTARLLEDLHKRHGRLPWAQLFGPALKLAEDGFAVSARLHLLLSMMTADNFSLAARAYFFDAAGQPHPIGHRLRNPAFVETLKALRDGGADAFYNGKIAQLIVDAVAAAPLPGDLTRADLAAYKVIAREPLCTSYRGYRICGMAPPSSGGMAVAQTLQLLEPFDLGRGPSAALNNRAMHLIVEAEKLAFADRDRYMADPDHVRLPDGLLDAAYLGQRRTLINEHAVMPRPVAGIPRRGAVLFGDDTTIESVGTSHLSIVDARGNAVSMTTTIEAGFGSRLFAGGFLLNNEMTDFSFVAMDAEGRPVANAIQPGKRPRSSMAPTLVFDETGELKAVLGSPGGSRIINYVVKALVSLIDWRLDPQAAAGLLNFGGRGAIAEVEFDPVVGAAVRPAMFRRWNSRPSTWYGRRLALIGHKVSTDLMTSGLHVVWLEDGKLLGGADPRREGVASGD